MINIFILVLGAVDWTFVVLLCGCELFTTGNSTVLYLQACVARLLICSFEETYSSIMRLKTSKALEMTVPAVISVRAESPLFPQAVHCVRMRGLCLSREPAVPLSNTWGCRVPWLLRCYLLPHYIQQFLLGEDYKDIDRKSVV